MSTSRRTFLSLASAGAASTLFPDLIRHDLIPEPTAPGVVHGYQVSGFGTAMFDGVEVAVPLEVEQTGPNGVFGGDPRMSSAATGAALVARLAEAGARLAAHVAQPGYPGISRGA